MYVLFLILVTPIVIAILALSLPVTYTVQAELKPNPSFSVKGQLWRICSFQAKYTNHTLEPSFSVLRWSIPKFKKKKKQDSKDGQEHERQEVKNQPKTGNRHRKDDRRNIFTAERIKTTLSLGRDIIQMIRPKSLRIEGEVGFPEPHITAYMLACLSQMDAAEGISIAIEPVWVGEYCDVDLEAQGRIIPIRLVLRAVAFACSRPIRELWAGKFRRRWRKTATFPRRMG